MNIFKKRYLESLKPTGKLYSVKDEKVPGLILMVTPKGAKTFYSYRWLAGKPERIKLGTFPAMTVEQARIKATEVNGAIAKDHNPAAVKRAIRAEPTFLEIFELYLDQKRNRSGKPLSDATIKDYRAIVSIHLGSISKLKLSQITPDTVRRLKIESDAQSNRARAIIGAVFNWANIEDITTVPSPARALKTRLIESRERFLLPAEFPRFMAALDTSPLRDFFLLALFTGARRSNVQAMRWTDINLDEATWRIPKTKNGNPVNIALPPEAVEILTKRKSEALLNAKYVFPGRGKTGHLVEPKKAWAKILEHAELPDLRLHDLRRTLGSWQARQGTSLLVIGKSLGHKSHQATQIYSRLDLDPIRASVEQATASMIEAGKGEIAKVNPATRKKKASSASKKK